MYRRSRSPESLREEYAQRYEAVREDGTPYLKLPHYAVYRLLFEWKDELAKRYFCREKNVKAVLWPAQSSILAHGDNPVGEKAYRELLPLVREIVGIAEEDFRSFQSSSLSDDHALARSSRLVRREDPSQRGLRSIKDPVEDAMEFRQKGGPESKGIATCRTCRTASGWRQSEGETRTKGDCDVMAARSRSRAAMVEGETRTKGDCDSNSARQSA